MSSDIFYGKFDMPMTSQEINLAKVICNKCEVQRDCLITAIKDQETYGVWGGFTSFERRTAVARNKGSIELAIDDYDNKCFTTPRKRKK